MPQAYDRGRSKGRAKGLPVPAMKKKEAKSLPIAAGKKQASQMVRSTVKRAQAGKLGLPTLKQAQKGKLTAKKNARIEKAYRADAQSARKAVRAKRTVRRKYG